MSLAFRDYLDTKFALDERSLNPQVRSAFLDELRQRQRFSCLDLGTGSGASIWRLLHSGLPANLEITAVDRDAEILALASRRLAILLAARDYEVMAIPGGIRAHRDRRHITIDFITANLPDFKPKARKHYDAVIAQALMDLLPPQLMARRIADWLRPEGVFYTSLNYDGNTTLFPLYPDEALEERILGAYDRSMEQRRVDGHGIGGARSGRRMHAALRQAGLEILTYGTSDWNLVPFRGVYPERESLCLTALLDMILNEAERSGEFTTDALDSWYQSRLRQIEAGELGFIVHQIDILARKPAPKT